MILTPRQAARRAVAVIPSDASVSADTPLLPLLSQREAIIRFPKHVQYRDRQGVVHEVDWVVAFPGYYTPLAPVFKRERNQKRSIRRELADLKESGRYLLVHCQGGAVVLQRQDADTTPVPMAMSDSPSSCSWLD